MANDKVLGKMREQIGELIKTLEQFGDIAVHPGASECEDLQNKLYKLQENLAVYKHQRLNQEVSPSFNIHARVSEEVKELFPPEPPPAGKPVETKLPVQPGEAPIPNKTPSNKIHAPIVVGINDKFRFINELFSQNPAEFNIAIEQLSALQNWNDSELYLNSLKSLYTWKEQQDVVKHFYSIVKRRFE
ncbi:MAG: hypothetical protein JNK73_08185 [Bacteroidia bacterium]|nr:hypothetical protein [Bacteroidia bacterium]